MFITKKHLSRRTVLRGVGASIALPLLDAMIPAATALAQTAAKPLPRLGFIYFPHGAIMDRWSPAKTGDDYVSCADTETARALSRSTDDRQRAAQQGRAKAAIRTESWPARGSAVSAPRMQARRRMAASPRTSLPHATSDQDVAFPSIELAGEGGGTPCDKGEGCGYGSTISFRTPTQPLPMENNPRKVFYRLFGQGDTEAERKAIARESGSILDLVADQAGRLERDLGGQDRAMLHDYLDSVREVERRTAKAQDNAKAALKLAECATRACRGLQRATQHDVRADRPRLPGQPDARRELHDGEGSEHADVQQPGCRRRIPPAVPSSERSGKNRIAW